MGTSKSTPVRLLTGKAPTPSLAPAAAAASEMTVLEDMLSASWREGWWSAIAASGLRRSSRSFTLRHGHSHLGRHHRYQTQNASDRRFFMPT